MVRDTNHALVDASWHPWATLLVFVFLAWPIFCQDLRELSVSIPEFLGVVVAWTFWAVTGHDAVARVLSASVLLLAGTGLMLVLPERLGESDVVLGAGMAAVLPL